MLDMKKRSDGGDEAYGNKFDVSYIPERVGRWVVEINDAIKDSGQFDWAIRALEMADEENPVQINLQCPGGSLDAADRLIHAMRKCKGHIHIVATGGCHSAATLILLEADSFELSENFNSLIHCGSLGAVGNLNEFVPQSSFASEWMVRVFLRAYEGFLSEDEIKSMIKGQDIWLDAFGWMKRYQQRMEYFKAKDAEEAEAKKKPARKRKVKQQETPALQDNLVE